ncbi:LppU/SCO3897 family protein [Kitasatospora azatica]|uniref:LppU/SCO3897 family protein n=1 Tax=Kitasatospora azatica TaxID=58347 RepID=UPI0012FBABFA|nr:hypothetical protein [Kitasatospora azatica]
MSTPPPPQGPYPPQGPAGQPPQGGFGPPPAAFGPPAGGPAPAYGAPTPPPQQGYAPPAQGYAQPQPGYAQPGQAPYAQQPQGWGAPPPQPKRRGKVILFAIVVPVVVIAVVLAAIYGFKHDPKYASVGDCVHNKGGAVAAGATDDHPDVTVIACSDASADAKVVGKEKGASMPEETCKKYSDADGYYTEQQGSDAITLCLHFLK